MCDVCTITKESVLEIVNTNSKRICFSEQHKQEPKKSCNSNNFGTINVPFAKGFKNIFPFELL